MLTSIDHVMICVPDLAQGIAQFKKLGFNMHEGGAHPGKGTHNAVAFNRDEYIELLAIRDANEYKAASGSGGLPEFIAAGGGIRHIVLQSDDLDGDIKAMRGRGVDVGNAVEGGRVAPSGVELKWKAATLGAKNALPLVFVQHLTALDERRRRIGRAHV